MATERTPQEPAWPTHLDPCAEHIYAIGRISVNYNELEAQLLAFIQHYDSSPNELTAFLFEKVPSNSQTEWLKKMMALRGNDLEAQVPIQHFISACDICTANRNLLIHSRIWAYRVSEDSLITSKRTRKTGAEKGDEFSLDVIRRVADEIQFWRGYGGHISAYLTRSALSREKLPSDWKLIGPSTLPGKPSLPINLTSSNNPAFGDA